MTDAREKVPRAVSPSRPRGHLRVEKGSEDSGSPFTPFYSWERQAQSGLGLVQGHKMHGSILKSKLALELRVGTAPCCHVASAGHGGREGACGHD